MEINQNLAKLFENYQNQQKYNKSKYDVNGDGKVNGNDNYQIAKERNELLKSDNLFDINGDGVVDFTDLFDAGCGFDIDGDGVVSEDEKMFLKKYKTQISNAVLSNLTKNKKDISLDDLMQFEKAVSEMDPNDKKFWQSQISSIEARMKGYVTSNMSKNKDMNGDNEVNLDDLRSFWEKTYGAKDAYPNLKAYLSSLETTLTNAVLKNDKSLKKADIAEAKEAAFEEMNTKSRADIEEAVVSALEAFGMVVHTDGPHVESANLTLQHAPQHVMEQVAALTAEEKAHIKEEIEQMYGGAQTVDTEQLVAKLTAYFAQQAESEPPTLQKQFESLLSDIQAYRENNTGNLKQEDVDEFNRRYEELSAQIQVIDKDLSNVCRSISKLLMYCQAELNSQTAEDSMANPAPKAEKTVEVPSTKRQEESLKKQEEHLAIQQLKEKIRQQIQQNNEA